MSGPEEQEPGPGRGPGEPGKAPHEREAPPAEEAPTAAPAEEAPAAPSEETAPAARPESATARVGWLPDGAEALFGEGARAEEAYDLLTVDVPAGSWISALETARDALGCRFFDWLSAVDEPGTGFRVCAHVVALPGRGGVAEATQPDRAAGAAEALTEGPAEVRNEGASAPPESGPYGRPHVGGSVRRLLLRTTVPHEAPRLPTATPVFAGAAWHERETHEMFGVEFADHPGLTPLLLPDSFEGHPLRKDFVLAARVAKAWPGAVEPGESSHGAPKRRQMLPPGVPDPNEWGPLKGQLPPVPSRPARGRAGRAGAGERPARRTRSASAGSASQQAKTEPEAPRTEGEQATKQPPGDTTGRTEGREQAPPAAPGPRSTDAPWHDRGDADRGPGENGTGRDGGGRGGSEDEDPGRDGTGEGPRKGGA